MKKVVSFLALLLLLASTGGLSESEPTLSLIDSGTLVLRIQGMDRGFEVFGLQQLSDGTFTLISSTSISRTPQPQIFFQDLQLDSAYRPVNYTLRIRESDGTEGVVRTAIKDNIAMLSLERPDGQKQGKTITGQQELAISDDNVASQYVILLQRFLSQQTASLNLDLLDPQELSVLLATVTRKGKTMLRIGDNAFEVDEVRLEFQIPNGPTVVQRIFAINGRFIGAFQVPSSQIPEALAFRSDLFPQGFEIPKNP